MGEVVRKECSGGGLCAGLFVCWVGSLKSPGQFWGATKEKLNKEVIQNSPGTHLASLGAGLKRDLIRT